MSKRMGERVKEGEGEYSDNSVGIEIHLGARLHDVKGTRHERGNRTR